MPARRLQLPRLPPPLTYEDELAASRGSAVGKHDIFPEEFERFLGLREPCAGCCSRPTASCSRPASGGACRPASRGRAARRVPLRRRRAAPAPPAVESPGHRVRRHHGIASCRACRKAAQDHHGRRRPQRPRPARSSRSSKATAPAPTSGAPACACSTPRSRRPTAASARSPGWKSSPARRPSTQFNTWLPDETVDAFREYLVGIKGPLTTPIGGGIRSLNVALRQLLDLYVCLRPVRWFKGVPSPVKHPEKVDMVIFRENTEDIYAGIEFEAGTRGANEGLKRLLKEQFPEGIRQDPLPRDSAGIGIKPVSQEGTERLVRAAIAVRAGEQAQERDPGAQGQHHEVHRRRLPQLGLRPGRARVRRPGLHLGAVGAHQEAPRARPPPTPSRRPRSKPASC